MPFDMETTQKLVWLVLLLLFAVGEAATVGLTSIWFAAGALAALIAALLGWALWIQIALFLIVSLLCLAAVRPLAKKHRIIGLEAPVTEDIDNLRGKGAVTVNGLTWSARSQDDAPIPAGTLVKILRIEGVKVFVERAPVAAGDPAAPKPW